jgi:hypothetical protein
LPRELRASFVEAVMRDLGGLPEIGDGHVFRAILAAQQRYFQPPADDLKHPSKYSRVAGSRRARASK